MTSALAWSNALHYIFRGIPARFRVLVGAGHAPAR